MPPINSDSPPSRARVLRVRPANLSQAVAQAAQVVRAGGIVAFPTETVYGIGASADGDAGIARLAALKGRDPSKPIALLLSDFSLAERFAADIPPAARRLADRYCPGPITLVLPARAGGMVGLRVPDHPLALAVVAACGGALCATSANAAGGPPARSADAVLAALPRGLDLVLDAGSTPIGAPSTVVRVDGATSEILREGAVSAADVAAAICA